MDFIGIAETSQAFDFIARVIIPPGGTTDLAPSNIYPKLNGQAILITPSIPTITVPKMLNP